MPDDAKTRYGIAEWYGKDFTSLNASQREDFAKQALGETEAEPPRCPFQPTQPPCSKRGGVCSIQRYKEGENSRIGARLDSPVITCPRRFEESGLISKWLAETAGFPLDEVLTLEDSKIRLQAAETVSREHFEEALKTRLRPL